MKRAWWPSQVYEARPWIALAIGVALATIAFFQSAGARHEWTFASALLFLAGCGLAVYGGVVLQLRREYRKRSKWYRENP